MFFIKKRIDRKTEDVRLRLVTLSLTKMDDYEVIASKIKSIELFNLMNEYHEIQHKIITYNKGHVYKISNDRIFALWETEHSSDKHADLACKTAIKQQHSMNDLRKRIRKMDYPEFDVRISIHTAELLIAKYKDNIEVLGEGAMFLNLIWNIASKFKKKIVVSLETKNQSSIKNFSLIEVKGDSQLLHNEVYELKY